MKLFQRLLMLAVLAIALFAFSAPTPKVEAAPPIDCDFIRALCKLTSDTDYQFCILRGGDPSACAEAEAWQTINCLRTAGCGDVPKGPGDN